MPKNGANVGDVNLWANDLGLLPIPIFPNEHKSRFVMLNGPTGNFCLDLSGDIGDMRGIAWSADVGHYVSVIGDDVEVQRWDAAPSVKERFSAQSVYRRLTEFHSYLEKSQPRYERSVVPHAIRVFRLLRATMSKDDGTSSLMAFLTLLACVTDDTPRSDLNVRRWSLAPSQREAASAISNADWEFLSDELMRGRLLEHLTLQPGLLLRHAAGQLFQEAHYEAAVAPQLTLPGFGPQPVSIKKKQTVVASGVHFTPPSLARMVVEQALAFMQIKSDKVRILDPACGSGEFLREALRQLRITGYEGEVELLGFDISEAACAMARFVLTWEKNADPFPVVVNVKQADSLALHDWPRRLDAVVMNPPFVSYEQLSSEQRSRISDTLGHLAKGRTDLSAAFVWKAVTSIEQAAVVATLVPASFLEAKATTSIRAEIQSFATPRFVARLGSQMLFRDVLVDAAALILQGGQDLPTQNTLAFWADHRIESTVAGIRALRRAHRTKRDFRSPTIEDGYSIYLAPITSAVSWSPRSYESWELLSRLSSLPKVQNLFDVHTGSRPGYLSAFVIDKASWFELPRREQRYFRPAVVNESISFGFLRDVKYVFYPYGRHHLSTERELRSELPNYYAQALLPSKSELLKRTSKREQSRWWEMSESRVWQHRPEPKIVSVYFGKAGSFAYDETGEFVVVQGFAWMPRPVLKPKGFFPSDLAFAYLAILDSPVMNDFLEAVSNPVQGGQWDLSSRFVSNIPMPNLSKSENSSLVKALAALGLKIVRGVDVDRQELREGVYAVYGATFSLHGEK